MADRGWPRSCAGGAPRNVSPPLRHPTGRITWSASPPCWSVDPRRSGQRGRFRRLADEALGMDGVSGGQHVGAAGVHDLGPAIVNVRRRVVAQAGMPMRLVVPGEEAPAEAAGVLLRSEAVRKLRHVLERLELGFAERVVVR